MDLQNSLTPFSSYDEYMKFIFDCVNRCLRSYLENMKGTYSNGQGGYKNVLYPDLELASDAANEQVIRFDRDQGLSAEDDDDDFLDDEFGDEASSIFGDFGFDDDEE